MTKTYVISISARDKNQHFNAETGILAPTMGKITSGHSVSVQLVCSTDNKGGVSREKRECFCMLLSNSHTTKRLKYPQWSFKFGKTLIRRLIGDNTLISDAHLGSIAQPLI